MSEQQFWDSAFVALVSATLGKDKIEHLSVETIRCCASKASMMLDERRRSETEAEDASRATHRA